MQNDKLGALHTFKSKQSKDKYDTKCNPVGVDLQKLRD
jgi:hypothetical protein